MSSIARNVAARNVHTTIISGKPMHEVAPVSLKASEAQDALFGHHYKQPGMPTPEDCLYWADQVRKALGQEAYEALLSRHGIQGKVVGLDGYKKLFAGLWERFVDYAKTAYYFGLSPQWAWDVQVYEHNDMKEYRPFIPDPITRKPVEELRGRWLLSHGESDSLFTVDSWGAAEMHMLHSGENIDDVTGVEHWELRYLAQETKGHPL